MDKALREKAKLTDEMPRLCAVNLVEGRGYPNCLPEIIAKLKSLGYIKLPEGIEEEVARKLASLDNKPYDDLDEHITRINQGLTKDCYKRRAKQIISLIRGERE